MEIVRVIGTAVSTVKAESMSGLRLLVVEGGNGEREVVADTVHAGFGDQVMLSRGTAARLAAGDPDCPIDAAITGIIDQIQDDPPGA